MLKLSIEKPLKYTDGRKGYARYRIDFENLNPNEKYVLGWTSPKFPNYEARQFLYNCSGWENGIVYEVYQDSVDDFQNFRVQLYRAGLIEENNEPEVELLEEATFGTQQPLD